MPGIPFKEQRWPGALLAAYYHFSTDDVFCIF